MHALLVYLLRIHVGIFNTTRLWLMSSFFSTRKVWKKLLLKPQNMIRTGPNPTDTQPQLTHLSEKRLGLCEACNVSAAQYTCPRCEVKTCSLVCLNLHKQELKCDGVRDRTKYIPLVKMTRVDLMNDYYFLEECTKFVQDRKRDRRKRFTCTNRHLPNHLVRLQRAAMERGTMLKFCYNISANGRRILRISISKVAKLCGASNGVSRMAVKQSYLLMKM
uniref:Box C/D snoRNA protein 1 n=1 Tax=Anopheles funestus TaxID=62324 RepID=A0A4Y0BFZ8_ANOFN